MRNLWVLHVPFLAGISHALRWMSNDELSFQEHLPLWCQGSALTPGDGPAWMGTGCQRSICSGEAPVMSQGYQERTGTEQKSALGLFGPDGLDWSLSQQSPFTHTHLMYVLLGHRRTLEYLEKIHTETRTQAPRLPFCTPNHPINQNNPI